MDAPLTGDDFAALLAATTRSAVHLELRDAYMADESFTRWLKSGLVETDDSDEWWASIVEEAVSRRVAVRRARIVSEPLSDYARWLWECTGPVNIAAGEEVRWLPRHHTSGLLVPPSDFWVFDDELLVWNHFDGRGEWAGNEVLRDPDMAKMCRDSFDAVWERATDHREYRPS
ncbi:DUF6879 family protein [Actinomadura hibisca]|uniref:DUF6879 family protein n=1 Tax=Actinomadura hibisca TaxID=68565 RepID=UPI000832D4A5|nr:DUF6879 family protein [Actinomadura hibisca]